MSFSLWTTRPGESRVRWVARSRPKGWSVVESGEDLLARDLADRGDGGVLDLALHRDRKEPLSDVLRAADQMQRIALPELLLDHVRCRQHAEHLLAEHGGEREVVELSDDLWANVMGPEPFVERAPKRRVAAREQDGNSSSEPGKPLRQVL